MMPSYLPPSFAYELRASFCVAKRRTCWRIFHRWCEGMSGCRWVRTSDWHIAVSPRHLFVEPNSLTVFSRLREICDYDPDTGDSVKIDRIGEILRAVQQGGEKAIVFSYLLEPLRRLRVLLQEIRLPCELLVGAMDDEERRDAIYRFKTGPPVALLASMRIASEGLTLVEANHVILVNRWWNPSLNQQALDRVVRIGQTPPCLGSYVYR